MEKNSESTKVKKETIDRIKNRNSIIYSVILIIFSLIIGYKLLISELTFDFSKFDFSDLLSLILAIFSISLAVVFYFKATDTSNLFYDNTYKFTKDISEILGRIEAGFGEKLRHIDEGYSGLINKFDKGAGPDLEKKVEEAKGEFEKEKQKLEKEVKEKQQILENALKKAKIEESERLRIIEQLNKKELEIETQTRELHLLKNQLNHAESIKDIERAERLPPDIQDVLLSIIRGQHLDIKTLVEAPIDYIRRRMKLELNLIPLSIKKTLFKYDICSETGILTRYGAESLKYIAMRFENYVA